MFAIIIIIINFYCSWLKRWHFPLKWVLVTHSHEGGQLSWMEGKEKGCREDSHQSSSGSHLSCRSRAFCTRVLTFWEWTWLRQRGRSPAVKGPQFSSDILCSSGPLLPLPHLYLIVGHQQYRIKHFHNCFPEGENKWKICMCLPRRSSGVGFAASGSWAHRSGGNQNGLIEAWVKPFWSEKTEHGEPWTNPIVYRVHEAGGFALCCVGNVFI